MSILFFDIYVSFFFHTQTKILHFFFNAPKLQSSTFKIATPFSSLPPLFLHLSQRTNQIKIKRIEHTQCQCHLLSMASQLHSQALPLGSQNCNSSPMLKQKKSHTHIHLTKKFLLNCKVNVLLEIQRIKSLCFTLNYIWQLQNPSFHATHKMKKKLSTFLEHTIISPLFKLTCSFHTPNRIKIKIHLSMYISCMLHFIQTKKSLL